LKENIVLVLFVLLLLCIRKINYFPTLLEFRKWEFDLQL